MYAWLGFEESFCSLLAAVRQRIGGAGCDRHTTSTTSLPSHQLSSQCPQINPVTVIGLLEVSGAKAGEHLLITAAGSTLSRMLIAAARAQGIKIIGTVRRPEAVQEVKDSTG